MRAPLVMTAAIIFVLAGSTGIAAVASAATAATAPNLGEATLAELQTEMAAGRLTAHRLTEYFLKRIETIDRADSGLHAVAEVNPEALAIADKLDEERRTRGARGPLHGIPVLIKDNIDTADKMLTTAGSLALMDSRPPRDATLVTRLRAAGAVILGKTNLSEWANFRSERSSSGWSARGGQTKNPYAHDRTPCGSSSGSAVAVAAGLAVVAVGTETDGSIVCPSSINGIVGIKPTVGLVSRSGVIPISDKQDTPGPMGRTVADAAALLTVIAGVDPSDDDTAASQNRTPRDFTAALPAASLKGVRIGVARNLAGFHEGVDDIFKQAIASLAAAGAVVVDPASFKVNETFSDDELTALLYEFKDGINRYLPTRPGAPQTLADLIRFNEQHRQREMPYFGQELFVKAEAKGPLTDKEYQTVRNRATLSARNGIDTVLKKFKLDALIAPTGGAAWTIDLVNGDHFSNGASQTPAVAGYPHVTVPAGFLHDLPIGVSFIGTAWSEAKLIGYAQAFEAATHARRAPAQ